mmetsp:Transcript_64460/g.168751  ORF Transcript_64460/g.168751 Transcript_64460/m.168751 type:complete len:292 (+) Transcript_64460:2485-3360(+)
MTATRFSSSSFEKSKSCSTRSPRPAWFSLLSSHISLASFFNLCLRLTRSTDASCFFIFSSFTASCRGSIWSSTAAVAPPSSSSYHCLSNLDSSSASTSASAAIFFAMSSIVWISSVIDAYFKSLSSLFLIPPFLPPASSSGSFFTASLLLLPLKKTGWPTGVFFCACSRRALADSQSSAAEARWPGPGGFVGPRASLPSRLLLRAPPLRPVLGLPALPFLPVSDPSPSLLTPSAAAILARASRAAVALVGPIAASGSSSSPTSTLGAAAALSSAFLFAILSKPRADTRERA